MLSRMWVLALVLILSLFSFTARAEFGEPYVTPSSPVSGETLFVNIYVYQQEYCEGIFSAPGYPRVTQEGNAVTIAFFGSRYESMDACPYMPGTAKRSFGSYPVGSYTLTVKLDYINGGGEWETDTLGVIPFTVTPVVTEAVAVPVWSGGAAIICVALLSISALLILRRRHGLWLVLSLSVLPTAGHSSDPSDRMVEMLLSTVPGAPSAEQLVGY